MSDRKAQRGAFAVECVEALRQTAYLIEHAKKAEMLSCLDWIIIRQHAAEVITWAAEEDGMMGGMMGGPELVQALNVRSKTR